MRSPFRVALLQFASFASQIEDAFSLSEAAGHAPAQRALVKALIDMGCLLQGELEALAADDDERGLLIVAEGCQVRWRRMQELFYVIAPS